MSKNIVESLLEDALEWAIEYAWEAIEEAVDKQLDDLGLDNLFDTVDDMVIDYKKAKKEAKARKKKEKAEKKRRKVEIKKRRAEREKWKEEWELLNGFGTVVEDWVDKTTKRVGKTIEDAIPLFTSDWEMNNNIEKFIKAMIPESMHEIIDGGSESYTVQQQALSLQTMETFLNNYDNQSVVEYIHNLYLNDFEKFDETFTKHILLFEKLSFADQSAFLRPLLEKEEQQKEFNYQYNLFTSNTLGSLSRLMHNKLFDFFVMWIITEQFVYINTNDTNTYTKTKIIEAIEGGISEYISIIRGDTNTLHLLIHQVHERFEELSACKKEDIDDISVHVHKINQCKLSMIILMLEYWSLIYKYHDITSEETSASFVDIDIFKDVLIDSHHPLQVDRKNTVWDQLNDITRIVMQECLRTTYNDALLNSETLQKLLSFGIALDTQNDTYTFTTLFVKWLYNDKHEQLAVRDIVPQFAKEFVESNIELTKKDFVTFIQLIQFFSVNTDLYEKYSYNYYLHILTSFKAIGIELKSLIKQYKTSKITRDEFYEHFSVFVEAMTTSLKKDIISVQNVEDVDEVISILKTCLHYEALPELSDDDEHDDKKILLTLGKALVTYIFVGWKVEQTLIYKTFERLIDIENNGRCIAYATNIPRKTVLWYAKWCIDTNLVHYFEHLYHFKVTSRDYSHQGAVESIIAILMDDIVWYQHYVWLKVLTYYKDHKIYNDSEQYYLDLYYEFIKRNYEIHSSNSIPEDKQDEFFEQLDMLRVYYKNDTNTVNNIIHIVMSHCTNIDSKKIIDWFLSDKNTDYYDISTIFNQQKLWQSEYFKEKYIDILEKIFAKEDVKNANHVVTNIYPVLSLPLTVMNDSVTKLVHRYEQNWNLDVVKNLEKTIIATSKEVQETYKDIKSDFVKEKSSFIKGLFSGIFINDAEEIKIIKQHQKEFVQYLQKHKEIFDEKLKESKELKEKITSLITHFHTLKDTIQKDVRYIEKMQQYLTKREFVNQSLKVAVDRFMNDGIARSLEYITVISSRVNINIGTLEKLLVAIDESYEPLLKMFENNLDLYHLQSSVNWLEDTVKLLEGK